jgi:hypothetical protein
MPDAIEIRAALARLIASPGFNKSPQLAQFLGFIVDETLAGRGDRIKAHTIGTDALGRAADFDSQIDPIVRVEAARLRRALAHYYANGGNDDPVIIELPRGNYVPLFRANPKRRRGVAGINDLRRQVTDAIREKYRLVLLIAVIATAVSLTVEAIEHTVWLDADNAPAATSAAPASDGPQR